eukprot:TRINITY_DN7975_c0_g1_i1.p1 TRINITY_DN7975_c0_g1~~TRINITY_DN7975_c0_g1_i1.p1  ORF type:complete len:283 (-),score=62.14 TRINITY_DN7975_c0_g1_i1:198-1046(-)
MVKILVAGEVQGKYKTLFSKVAALNAGKAGPFDLLLCVGAFTSSDADDDLAPYLPVEESGKPAQAKPPIPTYFFEPGDSALLAPLLQQHDTDVQELAPDLFYLGRGGIRTVGKLTVAFLSETHTPEDLEAARTNANRGGYRGADVLLTSEWPRGFDADLPDAAIAHLKSVGVAAAGVGSAAAADMAVATRPRYHFGAGAGAYYQRVPYRNAMNDGSAAGIAGRCAHVTRFISTLCSNCFGSEAVAAARHAQHVMRFIGALCSSSLCAHVTRFIGTLCSMKLV